MLGKLYRFNKYFFRSIFKQNGFIKLIKIFGYNSLDNMDKFYNEDGLIANKNLSFLSQDFFKKGYDRAVQATGGIDLQARWRFNIALCLAHTASKLEGDFVECGVARGFLSSGIMHSLNWNNLGKNFYLFDTFEGLDINYLSDAEKKQFGNISEVNKLAAEDVYCKDFEAVRKNFSEWQRVQLIKGSVPETLNNVQVDKVAYLHIDMNCVFPEIKAIEHFWPKVLKGGIVLLDDYAFPGCEQQQEGWDKWATDNDVKICTLPTGQGLILKTA
jgi:hypothetical protein